MLMKMHNIGKVKLHTEYGALGSREDFLDRATDALSVLKISNSYLESTLAKEDANQKTLTTFAMIKKSILKIEAFLDSAKHEEKHSSKNHNDHSPENIKKRWFALSELMSMVIPKNCPPNIQISLPKNDFQLFGNFYKLVVVFSNLVENSIEAMKNNGVINIFAREGTDFVMLDLKDSGPGFPPEGLKKVFSSLFTTKSGGNGLGLKVAKTIIETHGGTISVRNNPTTFSIKLPKN
jgi:signal transduction histidine kinase